VQNVRFNLNLFHGEADWEDSAAGVYDLLCTSVKINRRYLQAHPDCPSPFAKNADGSFRFRYLVAHARETIETFRTIDEIIKAGGSDCDGLVPFVVAWRIERENDPGADVFVQWKRGLVPGTLKFHVLEKSGRGDVGDPCRTLGMGRKQES
jgi:hypothetical protein